MTAADLHAAVAGYVEAHAPKQAGEAPSVDEAAAALAEEMAAGRVNHG